jgi:ribose 5-phosphate isomerase B
LDSKDLENLVRSVVEQIVDGASLVPSGGLLPNLANQAAAASNPGSVPSRTVAIGADHGGYPLKQLLIRHLEGKGYAVNDLGTHSTDAVDYPDFAIAVARAVANGSAHRGIMIDGAGIGSCMAANKVPGARAALCYDLSTARNAREHNNANLVTLGAGLIGTALATAIVDTFLATDCTEERHLKRVAKIDALDCAGTCK